MLTFSSHIIVLICGDECPTFVMLLKTKRYKENQKPKIQFPGEARLEATDFCFFSSLNDTFIRH